MPGVMAIVPGRVGARLVMAGLDPATPTGTGRASLVMAGLDPAICRGRVPVGMAGTVAGHDEGGVRAPARNASALGAISGATTPHGALAHGALAHQGPAGGKPARAATPHRTTLPGASR
ncbi:MAG: hypothetical protein BGO51_23910 [Rhodospirillales bacterium 69-11]|nr:MAG: hypothetical protein BGO51_23910 [Rhodospirillales bacterium 69-11]